MRSTGSPSWIERLTGLGPVALPPFAFGLSRRELRVAAFSPEAEGRTLVELQSVPLAEGLFGTGAIGAPAVDIAALEASLRTLLSRLAKAPREAALVLPDAWARGMMIDGADFPDDPTARREMLRFRLKRLVPFRTDELRVEAARIGDGTAESERSAERALVTFANDPLCTQLEELFSRCGVRLGWISGATAAIFAGLPALADRVVGLARVENEGFTLVLAADGEPTVWRQKSFTDGLADADRERLLGAEFRLTRAFLAERAGSRPLSTIYLAAPRGVEPFWSRVLEEGFGRPASRLVPGDLGVDVDISGEGLHELLPLAGAVGREVR
ncbi:MAG: hypothetical protein AB7G12_11110 [Thermoanaerobaculia bacterium]